MDNAFSNLSPQYRMGRDGFNWWIGQVEKSSREDPEAKGANRYKVRIIGEHLKDCEVVPTDDLPWASVVMPVTVPFNVGNKTGAHSQLKRGSWVIGFYLDPDRQKPIIMGSIGMTPGATKIVEEYKPGQCNSFTTFIDPDVDISKDGFPSPANPKKQASSQTEQESAKREPKNTKDGIQTGATLFDEKLAAEYNSVVENAFNTDIDLGLNTQNIFGNSNGSFATFSSNAFGTDALQTSTELSWGCFKKHDPPVPSAQLAPLSEGSQASEDWCQEKAKKCGPEDLKTSSTRLLGEFLAEVQRNNGNIGTYLVNQSTGGIYDAVYTARKYTNKFVYLIKHFVAKVKGFIIEKLTEGVELLIKSTLKPDETGNVLTPITEWFNKNLKDLGCQMADIGERLIQWVTDLLMGIINDVYQAVACQIDALVNGILAKLTALLEELIGKILGPLEDILGPVASALNLVGGAIAKVLEFLGITCSGPEAKCSDKDSECTNGEEKGNDRDFLDDILDAIDNDLFPDTSADYNQYRCEEAYNGPSLSTTNVSFRGGVFDTSYGTTGSSNTSNSSFDKRITYDIGEIEVLEGDNAVFTVTRTGYLNEASSVIFNTVAGSTATAGVDFVMKEEVVGFAPNEESKQVSVRTINDGDDTERDEIFFGRIKLNSPTGNTDVVSRFENNVATCTIKQRVRNTVEDHDPYETFEYTPELIESNINQGIADALGDQGTQDGGGDDTTTTPSYNVSANRSSVVAGEFVVYTVTTRNVADGTVLSYRLSPNITSDDVIGGVVSSTFVINNSQAKITVGIVDEYESDVDAVMTFNVNTTNASVDVLVLSTQDITDTDIGKGDAIENAYTEPAIPIVESGDIITDDSGKIIQIPVTVPGGPYTEAPFVTIGGNGIGAAATALLDNDGFVSEIRIISGGYGYKKNLPSTTGKRCIIDSFTLLRPGAGYSSVPTVYINDDPTVAEAIINDDGFVIGARVLNREVTFDKIPKVVIIGGGGYGAKLMPSLACLPESRLVELGATKIGTGRYVDCP